MDNPLMSYLPKSSNPLMAYVPKSSQGGGSIKSQQSIIDTAKDIGTKEAIGGTTATLAAGGIYGAKKLLTPSPQRALETSEKLTTEILNPPKQQLSRYLDRGKQMPAVRETAKIITKSKTFGELHQKLDEHIKNIMNERNSVLQANNRPLGDYTTELQNYISEQEKQGQIPPSELKQMKDVLKRERAFIKKNKLDRVSGQTRKEQLQDLTDSLLQKTEKGDIIDTQPARNRALDKLRRGLRREVHAGDKQVIALDSRYGGLKTAKKLVADQMALAQKGVSENFLEVIGNIIRNPRSAAQETARVVAKQQQKLASKTGKIERLSKIAGKTGKVKGFIGGGIPVISNVMDVAKRQYDPEAYDVSIQTGQDFWEVHDNLAKPGSLERKIQLGQVT